MKSLLELATPEQRRILEAAETLAAREGLRAWLVGGPVRDALLGRPFGDVDFTLEQGAAEFAASLARQLGGKAKRFDDFMTSRVNLPSGEVVDVTTTRAEDYHRPGALPTVRPAGLMEDLKRRDFTVNALALEIGTGDIADPFAGKADLDHRLLRVLHGDSFRDDPTRIFRATRLAARLGFELEPETAALMSEARALGAMDTVSRERRWRELRLAMTEPEPVAALVALASEGVLDSLIGTVPRGRELRDRLAEAWSVAKEHPELDAEILLLAALSPREPDLRGAGLPEKRVDVLRELLQRDDLTLRMRQSAPGGDLASASPELLALLERDPALREAAAHERLVRRIRLPFRGDELDVPPGPHVGKALRDARAAIASGSVDPSQARAFARLRALEYLRSQSS